MTMVGFCGDDSKLHIITTDFLNIWVPVLDLIMEFFQFEHCKETWKQFCR